MKHYYTVEIENKRSGSLRRVTIKARTAEEAASFTIISKDERINVASRIASNVEQRLVEKRRREEQEGT